MYNKIIEANKAWTDEVWQKLDNKLSRTTIASRDKIPYTTVNGVHDDKKEKQLNWWTNGFWGGLNWLMYIGTGKEDYKITAERSEELLDGVLYKDITRLHHDVGFQWNITSGVNYRQTENPASKNRALIAAMSLSARYNITGKFIRAWNQPERTGWTIIDTMMNLPLLYRATNIIGDVRFKKVAMAHADMAMKSHIRDDGSVIHIVSHDVDTGEDIETCGGQGYGVGSAWSRGAAWALYGFALSYLHTGKEEYMETAKKVANYFIASVSETGYLPLVDFKAPAEPVLYDSTAGAIAACGLIEIAKYVTNETEQALYLNAAIKILKAMEKEFCNWEDNEDSILQMGTEAYSKGIHIPIIYGDFYFAEAIYKLKGFDFLVW